MDAFERLKGLRTVLKMCFNVLERMETHGDDWQVGVKCQSDDKADYVHHILVSVLSELATDFGFEIAREENKIEVRKEVTKLRVLPPVKEESDNAKSLVLKSQDSPVSDSSASSSIGETVDDVINAFQNHFC